MPSKSEAQRRYLFNKFGPDWMKAHHFDNPGKLPEHVKKKGKKKPPAPVSRSSHRQEATLTPNVHPFVPLNLWQRAIDFPYVRPPPVEQMPPLAYLEQHPAYTARPEKPGWGASGWDWGEAPYKPLAPSEQVPPGRNLWDRSDPFATKNLKGLRNWYPEGTYGAGAVPPPSMRPAALRHRA